MRHVVNKNFPLGYKVCVLDFVQLEDNLEVILYFYINFLTEQDPRQTLYSVFVLILWTVSYPFCQDKNKVFNVIVIIS